MSPSSDHFPPVFATNRPDSGETVAHELNRLLAGVRQHLAEPPALAIATAYLNPGGFLLIADELEQAPKVRLLLGVLFGEVVLEDAGGGCPSERSVGSVVIVEVDEPVVGGSALGF